MSNPISDNLKLMADDACVRLNEPRFNKLETSQMISGRVSQISFSFAR